MTDRGTLVDLLRRSFREHPDRDAVVHPGEGTVTYQELAGRATAIQEALARVGVGPGDRVGLCLPKSVTSVATIVASLQCGAAYVPVGFHAPAARNAFIFDDCGVRALVVAREAAEDVVARMQRPVRARESLGDDVLLLQFDSPDIEEAGGTAGAAPAGLAYILYTSGSTGTPKGVMISHRNAVSFVEWAWEVLEVSAEDRFSSHAPFHFDLSIFDLYACLGRGATLVLLGEEEGRQPRRLAELIAEQRITVWYSTPSILSLLAGHGRLERYDCSALRYVLFAGEVFPVKHLRAVQARWPQPRYHNWYGPTETNVCTWLEVPQVVPEDRTEPYPIGQACSHARTRVAGDGARAVTRGEEGELLVRGEPVMMGYWNLPDRTAEAFVTDEDGVRWYRTGDIVREEAGGVYVFVGRRDRMVKRRGFRVELGEIEAALYRHPLVTEAAVAAHTDENSGVLITAYLCWQEQPPSLIQLKKFCIDNLPDYMVPDRFSHLASLPKTSTDKVDYQRLGLPD